MPTAGTSDQRESGSCSSHTGAVRLQHEVFFFYEENPSVHVNHCSTFCQTKQMMRIIHNQASINGLITAFKYATVEMLF